ncbi:MAG: hypothetical protein EOP43_05290 [Sphingobacteriaceae bacterium]|nr:MAG: hypothetical protein EOP43_05290 [Sphingobacteriaceae bacterium]
MLKNLNHVRLQLWIGLFLFVASFFISYYLRPSEWIMGLIRGVVIVILFSWYNKRYGKQASKL